MITKTIYVDELKENHVSFRFERGYKKFQTFYNGKFLGEMNGLSELQSGADYVSEDGNKIHVRLDKDRSGKSYFEVEYNSVPAPISPRYPVKTLKRASNWVLAFAIISTLIASLLIYLLYPRILETFYGYVYPVIAITLFYCFFGIRKYDRTSLFIAIIILSLDLLHKVVLQIYLDTFDSGLFELLEIIALVTLFKAIKPMNQMQEIKRRLQGKMSEDIIDDATF